MGIDRIADTPKGWDPIFEFQGKTYAEMDKEDKVSEPIPFTGVLRA